MVAGHAPLSIEKGRPMVILPGKWKVIKDASKGREDQKTEWMVKSRKLS